MSPAFHRRPVQFLAVAVASAAGCAVVSPPPMRMLHEPVIRPEPGGVTVAVAGGVGGGIFVDPFAGGTVEVGWQAKDDLRVEAIAGAGGRIGKGDWTVPGEPENVGAPDVLGTGRLGVAWEPLEWLTVRGGSGGGSANTGLAWWTADGGVSFGYSFLRRVRPYVGLDVSLSVPLDRGPVIYENRDDADARQDGRRPGASLFGGGHLGLSVRVAGPFELGAEGQCQYGWGLLTHDAMFVYGVTLGMRWTFGK